MDGSHRQERKKRAGRKHGQHVAEIWRGSHFDVFDHVGISFSAFDDAVIQHHQIFFEEYDVSRFLGYIYSSINGNTNIGSFHGCSIVDPVAHIADWMAGGAQRFHHPRFFIRRKLGEYSGGFSFFHELGVG